MRLRVWLKDKSEQPGGTIPGYVDLETYRDVTDDEAFEMARFKLVHEVPTLRPFQWELEWVERYDDQDRGIESKR